MTHLSGVITALSTPFTADDRLDVDTLRALVDRSVDGGVGAVLAGGSTGEFAALTQDERRLLVETVVDQAAGRVPVVAQTGSMSTSEAVALSQHAERVGADVVMVVAPYYEALTLAETHRYLARVAGSVALPVMLYNLPAATGVNLRPDDVRRLATDVPNVDHVKDTTGDLAQAAQLIHHHADVVSTFVGWDSLCLAAFVEGAAGVVAGSANVIPGELTALYRLVGAGDLAGARELWGRLFPLVDAMLSVNFIAAVKAALRAAGVDAGLPRDPVQDLAPADRERITRLVAALPSLTTV